MLKLCSRCSEFKPHDVRPDNSFRGCCTDCASDLGLPPEAPESLVERRWSNPADCYVDDSFAYEEGKYVYFVQGIDFGPIKIGYTSCLSTRLRELQSGNPVALRLIGVIPSRGRILEDALHKYFTDIRHHGEWFLPREELLVFIWTSALHVGGSGNLKEIISRSLGGDENLPPDIRWHIHPPTGRDVLTCADEDIVTLADLEMFIQRSGTEGRSRTDISQQHFRRSRTPTEVTRLIDTLLCDGRVRMETFKQNWGPGRPRALYFAA